MELKIIIRYIKKKGFFYIIVFHNIERKLCRKRILRYKDSDKMQMTNEVQVKLLEFMNSLITK